MKKYLVPISSTKRMAIAVTTLIGALSSSSFAADINSDLLDLLLKKGIITQEEYTTQKNKTENQDVVMKRLNKHDVQPPAVGVEKENNASHPIVGIAKEGEPEPIITIFGIADVAIANVSHSRPFSSTFPSTIKTDDQPLLKYRNVTGMINGGMQASRWGIRSNLDLGNDRKAFVTLESGFNLPTGESTDAYRSLTNGTNVASGNSSQNGQLFGRQAFVGLSDPTLGSISFGRQYNQIFEVLVEYDPVFKSDLFSPLGMSGTTGGGGGTSENARLDNTVRYKIQYGPVQFGALYKFGGLGMADPTSGYVFNAGYNEGNFGIHAVYEQFYDALKATAATTPTVAISDTRAYLINGKYKMDALTLKFGFQRYAARASTHAASVFAPFSISYSGTQISSVSNGAAVGVEQPTTITFAGGDYNFTPKFNLALGLYRINSHAYAAGISKDGSAVGAGASGTSTWTALVADYKINKYLDIYSGLSAIRFGGAKFAVGSTKDNSNFVSAVGLRFKF